MRKVRQNLDKKRVNARIAESDVGTRSKLEADGFEPATSTSANSPLAVYLIIEVMGGNYGSL